MAMAGLLGAARWDSGRPGDCDAPLGGRDRAPAGGGFSRAGLRLALPTCGAAPPVPALGRRCCPPPHGSPSAQGPRAAWGGEGLSCAVTCPPPAREPALPPFAHAQQHHGGVSARSPRGGQTPGPPRPPRGPRRPGLVPDAPDAAGPREAGGRCPAQSRGALEPAGAAGAAGGSGGAPGRTSGGHQQASRPGRDRELSGLVLLSSCPDATQQLHTFFTQLRRAGRSPATYRAVTAGMPAAMEGEIRTGLKLEQIGDLQLVVPVAAPSRRSVERKEVRKTLTRYEVLATAPGCALVQLQPLTAFPSQLLVHLTLLLCPALGDHLYSARVGTVLGESFLLPTGSAVPHTQVLGEQLLHRLRLTQQLVHRLPLHLHLHQLLLPTNVVTAPPPPFFLQTLSLLGLSECPAVP
ncbi:mitochondrial mRNA pseudouridine synthase RPUSD3 isoform X1 [Emydura macquarii macquarii]|uniref:mitochondrial mRNA pseudouridine synthase RPUSD3 isoform X1 n=1 Tax=Emydura macquarii macquarii TaxID=1129001 RepID=UPI00352B2A83